MSLLHQDSICGQITTASFISSLCLKFLLDILRVLQTGIALPVVQSASREVLTSAAPEAKERNDLNKHQSHRTLAVMARGHGTPVAGLVGMALGGSVDPADMAKAEGTEAADLPATARMFASKLNQVRVFQCDGYLTK